MGDTPTVPGARLAAAIATIDWGTVAAAVVSELGTPLTRIEETLRAMQVSISGVREVQDQMRAEQQQMRAEQQQMRAEQQQMRGAVVTLARSQSFPPPKNSNFAPF
jgi:chromosome segregation ATPase